MSTPNTYIVLLVGRDDHPAVATIRERGCHICDEPTPDSAKAAAERCVTASNYGRSCEPFYAWVLCPSGEVERFIVFVDLSYWAHPYPFTTEET